MKKKQLYLFLSGISICIYSCSNSLYYKKVKNNIGEFKNIITQIQQKDLLHGYDSINLKDGNVLTLNTDCIFDNDSSIDSSTSLFFRKYQLSKVCYSHTKDNFFDSSISFHKAYTPFLGNAITIYYDFGKSKLRDSITKGFSSKRFETKIMNDSCLFVIDKNPAFGE